MIADIGIASCPLAWPVGRPRRPASEREVARFGHEIREESSNGQSSWTRKKPLTIAVALDRLHAELGRRGAVDAVISTNVPTRLDGLPYSGAREPDDPAVAVYFRWHGELHCLPCDKWTRVADNLAAVAAHLDALRRIERYAVGDIAQAFAGYKALPAAGAKHPWWEMLGFENPPSYKDAKDKARELLRDLHPDRGGNHVQAAEINAALDEAELYHDRTGRP
jgi:hypothetical protein